MDPWAIIAISGGAFGILLLRTWQQVLLRRETYVGLRRKASLVALVLPSIALALEVALSTMAHFLPLNTLDDASVQGGWNAFLARLWLWSHIATGVMPLGGLVSAMFGNGRPRVAGAVWSAVAFVLFLFSFILSVNSFH